MKAESKRKKVSTTLSMGFAMAMVVLCSLACSSTQGNPYKNMTMEAFAPFQNEKYKFDFETINQHLKNLAKHDNDSTQTDKKTRSLYKSGNRLVWIDRNGIDWRADTLLNYLHTVSEIGFSEDAFFVSQIENDITRMRNLDFEGEGNDINRLTARIEYRLTKAYLRYCTGQQFGFINPYAALNTLDPANDDTAAVVKEYKQLFDIPISRPDNSFYERAIDMARTDSIGSFLRSVQPQDPSLAELTSLLKLAPNKRKWWLLMCNMERHRWRRTFRPEQPTERMIIVNIPSFMLYAFGEDSVMTMKIGCGATKTKTPLLTSEINRMDINPLWNIPMSIVRKDVAAHAGNAHYFASHRYFIVERETGNTMDPQRVTAEMLKSGKYRVSQEGGEGNSLGRIVFRFDNKFSVYLHDTSSRRFFDQSVRSVSHGCIRVERPFDLAKYLLGNDADSWTLDKIRISMDIEPETEKGLRYVSDTTRTRKLTNSKSISPKVPLYIVYQTLFKTPEGKWEEYGDIYGYDAVMRRHLEPFVGKQHRRTK